MAITMKSSRHSIGFTYAGFLRCRTRIAYLVSPEVGKHYEDLQQFFSIPIGDRKAFCNKYDLATDKLIKEGKLSKELADFLYAPDAGGTVQPAVTQKVLDVMGATSDNEDECFGRPYTSNAATWSSLRSLLWDCVLDKTNLEWY